MQRKLIQQGASTLMVSVPRRWTKKYGLVKGDEVTIDELDQSLLLSAEPTQIIREARITLHGSTESHIRTLITNAYRAGYDKVIATYEDQDQIDVLQHIIQTRLIGYEITNTDSDTVVVENLTEPSENLFETLLRKIFQNIQQLFELTEQLMRNPTDDILRQQIEETEERVQKYDNFCRRVISKGKIRNVKAEFFYVFLGIVVHGQREVYHFGKELKNQGNERIAKLMRSTHDAYNLLEQAYLHSDFTALAQLHDLEKELINDNGKALLATSKGEEGHLIYRLLSAIRQFYLANSPLTGILMRID